MIQLTEADCHIQKCDTDILILCRTAKTKSLQTWMQFPKTNLSSFMLFWTLC